MRGSPLGRFSLVFAGIATLLFGLHFANVMPVLNTVIAPIVSLFGALMGMLGYFERDKKRIPALVGMILGIGFLTLWVVLFVLSIGAQQ